MWGDCSLDRAYDLQLPIPDEPEVPSAPLILKTKRTIEISNNNSTAMYHVPHFSMGFEIEPYDDSSLYISQRKDTCIFCGSLAGIRPLARMTT
jgi:hypothetical protein